METYTTIQQFELDRIKEEFSKCTKPVCYENILTEEFGQEMSDGVKLKTISIRPKTDVPLPTIAIRTCYPKDDYKYRATGLEYAKRGFAYVYQYCRGTGGSEGVWEPNVNDRSDGSEFLKWLDENPDVLNIGYTGCSYLAFTGWVLADILPKKVKTLYLTHYGVFRHTSLYKDGLFRHDVMTAWSMNNAGFPVNADYIDTCLYRPHVEVDKALWGKKVDWYRTWVSSTDCDDPYWTEGFWGMMKEIPSKVKVPVYIGEGWFDHHLGSAIETYKALSSEAKNHSVLAIGAWNHDFIVATQGYKDTGKHFENNDILKNFYWMNDILVDGKLPKGRIDTYITGDDTWISRPTYEIENQKEKLFYLALSGEKKILTEKDNEKETFISYVYDPEDPTPCYGAESCLYTKNIQGSLKQPEPDYRSDVLSFISAPLTESITVLGTIKAVLTVASDCEDTSFAFKVSEVMTDGSAYNVRTGITTLGYRNGSAKRLNYNPDKEVEIVIDSWDQAWKFQKGSCIRVDISSADFPQYTAHSNVKGNWALVFETKKANQKVFVGGKKSYISFPLMTE